jgi:hypothetical protein
MLTQTLAEAQAEFELFGDLQGLVAVGGRHEPEEVRRALCASERSLRSMLANLGYGDWTESTDALALPTSASGGLPFVIVPWPANADEIVGFNVQPGGSGDWDPIDLVPWQQRHRYSRDRCAMYWAVKSYPKPDPADLDAVLAGELAVMPVPSGGNYSLDYTRTMPELTEDGEFFVGPQDWHTWRNLDAVVKFLGIRDGDDSGRAQWADKERSKVELRLRQYAPKTRSGPRATPVRRARGT